VLHVTTNARGFAPMNHANFDVDLAVLQSLKIRLAILIAAGSFMFACSTAKRPIAETPPPVSVTPADQPQQMAKLPPPQLSEVQDAVKRVFKESVVIDTNHMPAFIAADFNGDLSQDIAVVLSPAPDKLPELNREMPAWILRDLFGSTESRGPRLRIADKEVLLAVIHGYGDKGWRNPEATQTFLLKNAVGSGMEAHPLNEFTAANKGKSLPHLRGDVMGEILNGKPGYLYYAGATYAWYDPKTFKGEPEPGMVHGRPTQPKK
jgi:hypothetical protein